MAVVLECAAVQSSACCNVQPPLDVGEWKDRRKNGLCWLPATELARQLRRRQLTAVEVLEAHLEQIEEHNPTLNAVVSLDADRARQLARAADAA